jgi:3-methyladenine DNA glycosylase AlkD
MVVSQMEKIMLQKTEIKHKVASILAEYNPTEPEVTAARLRDFWLQFEPKSMGGIKAEQRQQQETVGIPVPVLQAIGQEMAKVAGKAVDDFIPLTRLLWNEYGREGRVVTVYPLGAMELTAPKTLLPLLLELCRTCITWEDADQMAMRALEPIVRKDPDQWLSAMEPWLADENKWVRRAGVTVVGRLAMKYGEYTPRCLALIKRLLYDQEQDVKRAVSFAIRLSAKGDAVSVRDFLAQHIPPEDATATWVLCDTIRSMARKLLPEFVSLLPLYQEWAVDPALSAKDHRSVESAVKVLQKAKE